MIRRSTWIVLFVFLALLATAYALQQRPEITSSQEATVTPQTILVTIPLASLKSLTISEAQGRAVTIERSADNEWVLVSPEAQVLDVAAADSAVNQLSSISALSTLENLPGLDVIGLATPQYEIELIADGGQKQVVRVGTLTATGSGYYVQVDTGPVYVVSKFTLENILKLVTDPAIVAPPTSQITTTPPASAGTPAPLSPTPTP